MIEQRNVKDFLWFEWEISFMTTREHSPKGLLDVIMSNKTPTHTQKKKKKPKEIVVSRKCLATRESTRRKLAQGSRVKDRDTIIETPTHHSISN